MVDRLRRNLMIGVPAALALRPFAAAAQAPLRIEITEGVIEPMPFAAPGFVPDSGGAADLARADHPGGGRRPGRHRPVPRGAAGARISAGSSSFDAPVQFADWKAINAQALVTGAVGRVAATGRRCASGSGTCSPRRRSARGCSSTARPARWRRLAHKVADQVYARLTGEGGYFDSRVAFVAASGPKEARRKQIGIMDYDGANAVMLTDGSALVLTPRISPDGAAGAFTSYDSGAPKVMMLEAGGRQRTVISTTPAA